MSIFNGVQIFFLMFRKYSCSLKKHKRLLCNIIVIHICSKTSPRANAYHSQESCSIRLCEDCPSSIVSNRNHINRIHKHNKKIYCLFCEIFLKTNAELLAHSVRHTEENWYTWELCHKKFSTSTEKMSHGIPYE